MCETSCSYNADEEECGRVGLSESGRTGIENRPEEGAAGAARRQLKGVQRRNWKRSELLAKLAVRQKYYTRL